jgi:hypothetical protein
LIYASVDTFSPFLPLSLPRSTLMPKSTTFNTDRIHAEMTPKDLNEACNAILGTLDTNRDSTSKAQDDIQSLCVEWQIRLRLQDWNIRVQCVPEMGGFARVRSSARVKEAVIYLCTPETVPSDWLGCRDIEVTLVHELLHLHARKFDGKLGDDESAEHVSFEAMIELTAIALVEAKRGIPFSRS